MLVTRLTCLLLTLLACLALPAAAQAFSIGMSDQKTGMWQDPRFEQLGIKQVRLLVAYDKVLRGDFSRYDPWMANAWVRGADVLLTIDRNLGHPKRLPSVAKYRRVVRLLRKRYPWVTTMGAWNEANHKLQPTYRNPRRAAAYYNVLRKECRGCRVVAADVLDSKNMLRWVRKFKRHARQPRIWGLHSYGDTNHFKPFRRTATRRLLRKVRGELWLTETGGIVRFSNRFRGGKRAEARAARAVRRTFAVAKSSPRIKRVYLYHWDADRRFQTWDSAFVAANGRARPALNELRREVNRQRHRTRQPLVPKFRKFL
jgi:hypothetical protein